MCPTHESGPRFSFPELLATANSVIAKQVELREGFYDRNDVPLLRALRGSRLAHTIEVDRPDGPQKTITADGFVIATGSRPFRPSDVDFRIRASSTATRCCRSTARRPASQSMAPAWWAANMRRCGATCRFACS